MNRARSGAENICGGVMLTYQSVENVKVARIKKAGRVVWYFLFATMILVATFRIIIPGFVLIYQGAEPPAYTSGFSSEEEAAEYRKLLRYHGLSWDIAIIEEDPDGSLWFYRDGQRCRLQWPAGR